jgi:hypothetical protein
MYICRFTYEYIAIPSAVLAQKDPHFLRFSDYSTSHQGCFNKESGTWAYLDFQHGVLTSFFKSCTANLEEMVCYRPHVFVESFNHGVQEVQHLQQYMTRHHPK